MATGWIHRLLSKHPISIFRVQDSDNEEPRYLLGTITVGEDGTPGGAISINADSLPSTAVSNPVDEQGALLVAPAYAIPATLSADAAGEDVLASTHVGNFKSLTLQVAGDLNGTWRIQGSLDNTTFVDLPFVSVAATGDTPPATTSTAIAGIFSAYLGGVRYVRVRVTARTSGAMTGTVILSTLPVRLPNPLASGTLTTNTAAPAANNIGALVARANAAFQTLSEGFQTLLSVDLAGFLRVRNWKAQVSVTFTLDTSAYASGDVLADTQVISNFFAAADDVMYLDSITLNDKDDQGAAMTIVILNSNVSFGTENAAPSISDANADFIQALIDVPAAGWYDVGGAKVQTVRFSPVAVKATSGTRDLYVALWNGTGTPTYTATGITGKFGGS